MQTRENEINKNYLLFIYIQFWRMFSPRQCEQKLTTFREFEQNSSRYQVSIGGLGGRGGIEVRFFLCVGILFPDPFAYVVSGLYLFKC